MIDYRYSYMIGNLIFSLVWLGLFIIRKDLRHKILIMSFIIGFFGPISQLFYLRDYWHPILFNGWRIGIEDYLFSFFIGGIACVIYEELFGLKFSKRHLKQHKEWMGKFILIAGFIMILGNIVFGFNSIYVSIFMFSIFGLVIVSLRHDLLKAALLSGVLLTIIMLSFYIIFTFLFPGIIQNWWKLKNLSGILILGIPLEELLWASSWGFVAGPVYEFITGLGFKHSKK